MYRISRVSFKQAEPVRLFVSSLDPAVPPKYTDLEKRYVSLQELEKLAGIPVDRFEIDRSLADIEFIKNEFVLKFHTQKDENLESISCLKVDPNETRDKNERREAIKKIRFVVFVRIDPNDSVEEIIIAGRKSSKENLKVVYAGIQAGTRTVSQLKLQALLGVKENQPQVIAGVNSQTGKNSAVQAYVLDTHGRGQRERVIATLPAVLQPGSKRDQMRTPSSGLNNNVNLKTKPDILSDGETNNKNKEQTRLSRFKKVNVTPEGDVLSANTSEGYKAGSSSGPLIIREPSNQCIYDPDGSKAEAVRFYLRPKVKGQAVPNFNHTSIPDVLFKKEDLEGREGKPGLIELVKLERNCARIEALWLGLNNSVRNYLNKHFDEYKEWISQSPNHWFVKGLNRP